MTMLALVEPLAGIGRHGFSLNVLVLSPLMVL